MPNTSAVGDGVKLEIRRSGSNSEVHTYRGGQLLYLLRRPWENRFDRRRRYGLYEGRALFYTDAPLSQPLLTLVRVQHEGLIRLQAPDRTAVTNVIRIDDSAGYIGSDPRHRLEWAGNTYLLTARSHSKLWGGRDVDCVNEQTREMVMQFAEKNFSSKEIGTLTISSKFSGAALSVMVAAFFSFREFDQRRKMLICGDPVFTANLTG